MPAGLLLSLKSLFRGALHSADTSVVRSIHIMKTKIFLPCFFLKESVILEDLFDALSIRGNHHVRAGVSSDL